MSTGQVRRVAARTFDSGVCDLAHDCGDAIAATVQLIVSVEGRERQSGGVNFSGLCEVFVQDQMLMKFRSNCVL
jgi:hypothetical protein